MIQKTLDFCEKAAELGDVDACIGLARYHLINYGFRLSKSEFPKSEPVTEQRIRRYLSKATLENKETSTEVRRLYWAFQLFLDNTGVKKKKVLKELSTLDKDDKTVQNTIKYLNSPDNISLGGIFVVALGKFIELEALEKATVKSAPPLPSKTSVKKPEVSDKKQVLEDIKGTLAHYKKHKKLFSFKRFRKLFEKLQKTFSLSGAIKQKGYHIKYKLEGVSGQTHAPHGKEPKEALTEMRETLSTVVTALDKKMDKKKPKI